jgi:hypothetical protein
MRFAATHAVFNFNLFDGLCYWASDPFRSGGQPLLEVPAWMFERSALGSEGLREHARKKATVRSVASVADGWVRMLPARPPSGMSDLRGHRYPDRLTRYFLAAACGSSGVNLGPAPLLTPRMELQPIVEGGYAGSRWQMTVCR